MLLLSKKRARSVTSSVVMQCLALLIVTASALCVMFVLSVLSLLCVLSALSVLSVLYVFDRCLAHRFTRPRGSRSQRGAPLLDTDATAVGAEARCDFSCSTSLRHSTCPTNAACRHIGQVTVRCSM